MYRHAFVVDCDERSLRDSWTLLNSIYAYYERELRVFVVSYDSSCRDVLKEHPLGNALTILDGATFEVRSADVSSAATRKHPQTALSILAHVVATACVLDCRSVLVSRLDDVFRLGDEGKIVTSYEGSRLPAQILPRLSGGFICLNLAKHWELVALFDFACRFAIQMPDGGAPFDFAGKTDSEIISVLVQILWKHNDLELLPHDVWRSPSENDVLELRKEDAARLEILNRQSNSRQRFIHRRGLDGLDPTNVKGLKSLGLLLSVCDHFKNLIALPFRLKDAGIPQITPAAVAGTNSSAAESPANLVIGIITCPRPGTHFVDTVIQLRDAGFEETIHVFCEPGVTTVRLPNVVVHENHSCLGGVGNWRHCLEWLLTNTSAEYFLMCEDDVACCAGAKAALDFGLGCLTEFGFLSLYTPFTERSFYEQHGADGWIELNRGWRAIGMQAVCLKRGLAMPLLQCPLFAEVDQMGGPTDAVVAKFFLDRQIPCYYHFPSLTEHLGRISVNGHGDHRALNFNPQFAYDKTAV